jgi:hypothetical protein
VIVAAVDDKAMVDLLAVDQALRDDGHIA